MFEAIITSLKEEFSFMRGNLLTLIISWMFLYFTFSLVMPFEAPFIQGLGAPPIVIGFIGSVASAMLSIARIPGAYIADKYITYKRAQPLSERRPDRIGLYLLIGFACFLLGLLVKMP